MRTAKCNFRIIDGLSINSDEFFCGHVDVTGDFAKQDG
jgi:hypothetical protein